MYGFIMYKYISIIITLCAHVHVLILPLLFFYPSVDFFLNVVSFHWLMLFVSCPMKLCKTIKQRQETRHSHVIVVVASESVSWKYMSMCMWSTNFLIVWNTVKWVLFQIELSCLFLLLPKHKNYLQLLKAIAFCRFHRLLVAQETPWMYLHTQSDIAGFSFWFSRQVSELVRSHTRWVSGNPITAGLPRNWQILFLFWTVVKISKNTVYYTTSLLACVIHSVLSKKHPSVPRSVSLGQYYALTNLQFFTQMKKTDGKICFFICPKNQKSFSLVCSL